MYGNPTFIWWVGVIENRVDPMALGRCQVRIFGWHPQEKNLLPTDKLPWAQAMQPLNNAKTASPPRIGEWVVGFFMDGELGQMPVMMGVLPGLHNPDITCKQNPAASDIPSQPVAITGSADQDVGGGTIFSLGAGA